MTYNIVHGRLADAKCLCKFGCAPLTVDWHSFLRKGIILRTIVYICGNEGILLEIKYIYLAFLIREFLNVIFFTFIIF